MANPAPPASSGRALPSSMNEQVLGQMSEAEQLAWAMRASQEQEQHEAASVPRQSPVHYTASPSRPSASVSCAPPRTPTQTPLPTPQEARNAPPRAASMPNPMQTDVPPVSRLPSSRLGISALSAAGQAASKSGACSSGFVDVPRYVAPPIVCATQALSLQSKACSTKLPIVPQPPPSEFKPIPAPTPSVVGALCSSVHAAPHTTRRPELTANSSATPASVRASGSTATTLARVAPTVGAAPPPLISFDSTTEPGAPPPPLGSPSSGADLMSFFRGPSDVDESNALEWTTAFAAPIFPQSASSTNAFAPAVTNGGEPPPYPQSGCHTLPPPSAALSVSQPAAQPSCPAFPGMQPWPSATTRRSQLTQPEPPTLAQEAGAVAPMLWSPQPTATNSRQQLREQVSTVSSAEAAAGIEELRLAEHLQEAERLGCSSHVQPCALHLDLHLHAAYLHLLPHPSPPFSFRHSPRLLDPGGEKRWRLPSGTDQQNSSRQR